MRIGVGTIYPSRDPKAGYPDESVCGCERLTRRNCPHTSKRPYKEAWSSEQGIAAIDRGAGAQFDPGVVSAFRELYTEGEIDRIRAEVQPA